MTDQLLETLRDTLAESAGEIRRELGTRRSYQDGENPSGERQLAADVYADELLADRLLALEELTAYASEEREGIEHGGSGRYHVSADPLDGSSNLTSNNTMGTIIGVYDEPLPSPADALVAAAYVLYGPVTTMLTLRDGRVREYLVRDGTPELLDSDVSIPEDPLVYGFGGRAPDWLPAFDSYVEELENDRLKLRYAGAMVADVNQVLTYGGIFGYPMLTDRPEGKLRLQFEGVPMAAIVDAAGGASTDGDRAILETPVEQLHQRSPVFVGNEPLIDRLEAALD